MIVTLALMIMVNLLGSELITTGVLGSVFTMLVVTILIWFFDVTKWQYQDRRIDPSALASDLEESIRRTGIDETIERFKTK